MFKFKNHYFSILDILITNFQIIIKLSKINYLAT